MDKLMTIAWRDFLLFAMGYEPLRERFAAMTGTAFDLSDSIASDFAMWVTLDQWGEEGVPPGFLKDARERFPAKD